MVLRTYDWIVLGLSNRFLWRCPTAELLRLYDRNVSERHLDVGVGTGYFLDKSRWSVAKPAITLLDLNPNCLTTASRRIRRYTPQTVLANVLAPLPPLGPFQSAGLCYLLHCLPGTMEENDKIPRPAPIPNGFQPTGQAPTSNPSGETQADFVRNCYHQRLD